MKIVISILMYIVTVSLTPLCVVSAQSNKAPKPIQECAWTGQPGNLATWGYTKNFIYGKLAGENVNDDVLVFWKWHGNLLRKNSISKIPRTVNICPAIGGTCGLSLEKDEEPWPYAIVKLENGEILKQWNAPQGWWISLAGGSVKGKYIGLYAKESAESDSCDLMRPRARIAIIDVEKKELRWVGELKVNSEYGNDVRSVAVTDDGRYIAVAGWENGTGMVDAKAGKVLWSIRPTGEVSTGYAVFSPDGKYIYTTGSEGCVYGIEVLTGKIINKRWATQTGESIYAHRASSIAISNDGKWLAAGTGPEGEVYLWNLKNKDKATVLPHGEGTILIVAFSPDNQSLASVGGGVLKVWRLERKDKKEENKKDSEQNKDDNE